MIYELRTYTVRVGTLPEVIKLSGTLSREIRKDDYGKLVGYWATEIGPLNQVIQLWGYADLNERQRLRAELGKNQRWMTEYVPLNRALMVRQDNRFLSPVVDPVAPATTPNIYELRNYRAKPGAARQWAEVFRKILPVRERFSKMVGLWLTEAGQPNEICHIWAYKDLNHRAQVRADVAKTPEWQAFLKESAPLLDEMNSTVMLPVPHSPMA
jgi:hypothetical protein